MVFSFRCPPYPEANQQGDNGAELLAEGLERSLPRGKGKGPGAEVKQHNDPCQDGQEVKSLLFDRCLIVRFCHSFIPFWATTREIGAAVVTMIASVANRPRGMVCMNRGRATSRPDRRPASAIRRKLHAFLMMRFQSDRRFINAACHSISSVVCSSSYDTGLAYLLSLQCRYLSNSESVLQPHILHLGLGESGLYTHIDLNLVPRHQPGDVLRERNPGPKRSRR